MVIDEVEGRFRVRISGIVLWWGVEKLVRAKNRERLLMGEV